MPRAARMTPPIMSPGRLDLLNGRRPWKNGKRRSALPGCLGFLMSLMLFHQNGQLPLEHSTKHRRLWRCNLSNESRSKIILPDGSSFAESMAYARQDTDQLFYTI